MSQTSRLRDHLRQLDSSLAERADAFWVKSKEIHERLTQPDDHINGEKHCLSVEDNIYYYITESNKAAPFTTLEKFLLSVAACSHDFDKGLKSSISDPSQPHGVKSGDYLRKQCAIFGLNTAEVDAVADIVGVHDLKDSDFVKQVTKWLNVSVIGTQKINMKRLAVVFKVGDVMHTDSTRVPLISVDPAKLSPEKRSKYLARKSITGWGIDGSRVIISAKPEDVKAEKAVRKAEKFMKKHEWQPLKGFLLNFELPNELHFDIHPPRRGASSTPSSKARRSHRTASPASGATIGGGSAKSPTAGSVSKVPGGTASPRALVRAKRGGSVPPSEAPAVPPSDPTRPAQVLPEPKHDSNQCIKVRLREYHTFLNILFWELNAIKNRSTTLAREFRAESECRETCEEFIEMLGLLNLEVQRLRHANWFENAGDVPRDMVDYTKPILDKLGEIVSEQRRRLLEMKQHGKMKKGRSRLRFKLKTDISILGITEKDFKEAFVKAAWRLQRVNNDLEAALLLIRDRLASDMSQEPLSWVVSAIGREKSWCEEKKAG